MKKSHNMLLFLLALMATVSCVEAYEPEVITDANNFLVVEGFLNSGNDSSAINLSRTVQLASAGASVPESEARVEIESKSGSATYQLKESGGGNYVLEPVELNPEDRYRLKIQTRDGNEYLSDYVEVKVTPPIDSISWIYEPEGVTIYANTHDPDNKSWYYRWEYEETWQYFPRYVTSLIYDYRLREVVVRPEPTPTICWSFNKSTNIITGSSAKLSEDLISEQMLTFIPRHAQRISNKYSILIKQYVLNKEAFEYYEQIKKNSESMGSLFDPQPMELQGNIYNINSPDEPVVGYFNVGSLQEKRIFINNGEIRDPYWLYNTGCSDPEIILPGELHNSPLVPFKIVLGVLYGVMFSCVDCLGNDSSVEPSFWE